MPRTVTTWSESGGTGKTTTAMNLAAALARRGEEVLAIDLDPQKGSLTEYAGHKGLIDDDDRDPCRLLVDETPRLGETVVDAGAFDLVPGHEDLSRLSTEAADVPGREFLLRREIEALAGEYDRFVVDPPASSGLLVDNALIATRNVLIPMELTRKGVVSIEGLEETVDALESALRRANPEFELDVLGVVPNKVRPGVKVHEEKHDALREAGRLVLPVTIRNLTVLEKSWDAHRSIFAYADADDTPDLRKRERYLLDAYDQLAGLVVGEPVDDPEEVSA